MFTVFHSTCSVSRSFGLARLGGLARGAREGAERYEVRRCRSSGRRKTADNGEPASCGALEGYGKVVGFGRRQAGESPGAGREQRKPNTSGAPGARPSHSTRVCRRGMGARASTTDYEWPVRARALQNIK